MSLFNDDEKDKISDEDFREDVQNQGSKIHTENLDDVNNFEGANSNSNSKDSYNRECENISVNYPFMAVLKSLSGIG